MQGIYIQVARVPRLIQIVFQDILGIPNVPGAAEIVDAADDADDVSIRKPLNRPHFVPNASVATWGENHHIALVQNRMPSSGPSERSARFGFPGLGFTGAGAARPVTGRS